MTPRPFSLVRLLEAHMRVWAGDPDPWRDANVEKAACEEAHARALVSDRMPEHPGAIAVPPEFLKQCPPSPPSEPIGFDPDDYPLF